MTESNSLVVTGLVSSYRGRPVVHDVSFVVNPGTILALTGPSGSGKSTVLWTLSGAHRVTSGEVRIGDAVIDSVEAATAAGVAVMPQGGGLALAYTAYENVALSLLARGLAADRVAELTLTALASVGLSESRDHVVDELSGGQQQRVALARLVSSRAGVLLADEPTSEVDPGNRELILTLLRAAAADGATVVLATHDEETAARADVRVELADGRVQPSVG